MDRDELLERVRAARARTGTLTVASLRREGLDALGAELASEQAGTLGRLGRRLDLALVRLAEIAERAEGLVGLDREGLVREHEQALLELHEARWEMLVVREAMGLRNVRRDLDLTWPVPPRLTAP